MGLEKKGGIIYNKCMMTDIMAVAKKIGTLLAGRAYHSLERNHKVLKLLKALEIGELKENVESVYAHALVEYAVDNPVEFVTLFALKDVKEAFQNDLYKTGQKEFEKIIEHHFNTNEELSILRKAYKSAADLQPEINRFRELYDYFVMQTANAFQLKKYNEFNEFMMKKSFDFQAENYLNKLVADFREEFLRKNLYIDLNAETRVDKKTVGAGEKPHAPDAAHRPKEKGKEEENDPELYDSIRHKPLDTYIQKWLREDGRNFLVIIGEYGTGKTTFLKHMAHQLAAGRLEPGSITGAAIGDRKNRLPLFFPLRNFEKSMESYIVSQLNTEGITDIDFARFTRRIKDDELLLLLDGFDEMTQKIDADEKGKNFDKIRKLIDCCQKSKIILTTRREYFQSASELQKVFKHRDKKNYDFVHLLPFDDDQIQQYLQTHTDDPGFYWEQIEEIFDLHDLAKRPVLLQLIVDYLPGLIKEKVEKETINASDLYERCIADELDRKSNQLDFIIPNEYRLEILQKLAVWMFLNDALSFDTGLLESELNLRHYFKTDQPWEFVKRLNEFLTFTFLIREADNVYRISHKSFRDYLTAQAFVREIKSGKIENFGKSRLSKEVGHFMKEQEPGKETLLQLVLTARDLSEENRWQGTNAANVLLEMDRTILKGKDLSGCQLAFVDFSRCDLTGTNFKDADLSNCHFYDKSILSAHLGNTNFENSPLKLWGQGITDITALKGTKNLTSLDLDNNPITDISHLQGLKNLTLLFLDSTVITDISHLQGLKNLRSLVLCKNQIAKNQIEALKQALPEITIREYE